MNNPDDLTDKEYLGDGAYVGFDSYHVWLYTFNGISVTNKVALEPAVLNAFQNWLKHFRERYKI